MKPDLCSTGTILEKFQANRHAALDVGLTLIGRSRKYFRWDPKTFSIYTKSRLHDLVVSSNIPQLLFSNSVLNIVYKFDKSVDIHFGPDRTFQFI